MKTKEQIQKLIEEKQKELDQLKQELQTAKSPKEDWEEEYVQMPIGLKAHSKSIWGRQVNLMAELQTFAKLRNGDWVADWGDDIDKFGITLNAGEAKLDEWCSSNPFVYVISFESEEIAQEAIEIFGQRIEQFYGK